MLPSPWLTKPHKIPHVPLYVNTTKHANCDPFRQVFPAYMWACRPPDHIFPLLQSSFVLHLPWKSTTRQLNGGKNQNDGIIWKEKEAVMDAATFCGGIAYQHDLQGRPLVYSRSRNRGGLREGCFDTAIITKDDAPRLLQNRLRKRQNCFHHVAHSSGPLTHSCHHILLRETLSLQNLGQGRI